MALQSGGGFLPGIGEFYLDPQQIVALSKVPSMDELIAKMMGSINSPVTGVVLTVNAVTSGLVRAIDAVAKQKAEAA